MPEVDEFGLGQEHRTILSQSIKKYLDDEAELFELEECISSLNEHSNSKCSNLIIDIYHLLQHFDIDYGVVKESEGGIMSDKVRNIANLLMTGSVDTIQKSIDDFFANPYERE